MRARRSRACALPPASSSAENLTSWTSFSQRSPACRGRPASKRLATSSMPFMNFPTGPAGSSVTVWDEA